MAQPLAVSASATPFHPHFQREVDQLMLPLKHRTYALMQLRAGDHVLDVGCGPASDTIALADRVGLDGFVVGIDSDKASIAEAERKAISAGVGDRVRHRTVNTLLMPFAPASFDAVRCERTFQYLERPELALAEIVRVTKPGGRIVLADVDWGAGAIDTPHAEVARILQETLAERILPNGNAGRTLYRLMKQARLQDVIVEMHPIWLTSLPLIRLVTQLEIAEETALEEGRLSLEQVERWRADLERYAERDWLFAATSLVIVAGVVPPVSVQEENT